MEGLEIIIAFMALFWFGPPLLLFIIGAYKRRSGSESAKVFFILGVGWVIIGGGICASMLMG